ncbi:MAG: C25 family cysteine peptidase, partial [Candidatus Cloacimonadales bacterium]|nr:C25 family cysteine peptidase [Candidatus Cloacimonadales bacterium]
MKLRLFLIIILLPLGALFAYQTQIISESPEQIQFIIKMDSLKIQTNAEFSFFRDFAKMSFNTNEGEPELPFILYNIAVPANGNVSVNIKPINEYQKQLTRPLQPAPRYFYDQEEKLQTQYKIDNKKYQNYPQISHSIEPSRQFRGYNLIPVKIYPVHYYEQNKRLNIIDEMIVTINISGNTNAKRTNNDNWDSFYAEMFLNWQTGQRFYNGVDESEVNFAPFNKSNYWYSFEASKDGIYRINASQIPDAPLGDIDPHKIRVFTTGGSTMSSYPSDPGHEFVEVPIYVSGADDGNFDQQDYILLYARDRDGFGMNSEYSYESNTNGDFYYYNPYSGANKYWLTWGEFSAPAKRIESEPLPNNWAEEKNSVYFLQHIESERARMNEKYESYYAWYSQKMEGRSNASYLFNFNVEDLDISKEKSIRAFIKTEQATGIDRHNVKLSLNGTEFKSLQWSTSSMQKLEGAVANLTEGANSMQLDVFRTIWSDMFLDFYDVMYYKKLVKRGQAYSFAVESNAPAKNIKYQFQNKPSSDVQVYRVKDFNKVTKITPDYQNSAFSFVSESRAGDEFWVVQNSDIINVNAIKREQVKDLAAETGQVDFIIVTNKALAQAAEELKEIYQQAYSLNAKIAYQEDIINQFAGGNDDPMAIRNYLKYLYEICPAPKLKGAVLLGFGTIDWRNYSGMANNKNQIMTMQIKAQSSSGGTFNTKTSSDQYFAYITNISAPDLIIGRIPITNMNEWAQYKNKLVHFLNSKQGTWTNQALFLADDFNYVASITDTMHSYAVETISAILHESIFKEKIFAQDYPLNEFKKKPEVNNLFVDKIKKGALITVYMGHGDPVSVGDENYLRVEDMPRLDNIEHLTTIIFGSCSVGRTDNPNIKSMAEYMIMNP